MLHVGSDPALFPCEIFDCWSSTLIGWVLSLCQTIKCLSALVWTVGAVVLCQIRPNPFLGQISKRQLNTLFQFCWLVVVTSVVCPYQSQVIDPSSSDTRVFSPQRPDQETFWSCFCVLMLLCVYYLQCCHHLLCRYDVSYWHCCMPLWQATAGIVTVVNVMYW